MSAERLTRRDFLTAASAALVGLTGVAAAERFGLLKTKPASAEGSLAVLPPSAINIEKDPDKIAEITRNLITKINQMFPDAESRVDATGFRISNGWRAQDGFKYLAFQRVIFQEEPSERVNFWNTLDNMSEYGLDTKLDSGELGVTIPPMQRFNDRSATLEGIFTERITALKVPDAVFNFVKEIRRVAETGVFTGYKDYGPYEVWRYQRGAVQKWNDGENKGLIQGILAGDAAAAAGLIPKDILLDKPDLGSGGGGSVDQTPQVNVSPRERQIIQTTTLVDSATVPGKSVPVIEVRASNSASTKLTLNPEVKNEFASIIGASGKSGMLVTLGSMSEVPAGVVMNTNGRFNPANGTFTDQSKVGAEVVGDKIIVYVVPIFITTADAQVALADRFARAVLSGGDTVSDILRGQPSALQVIQRQPFTLV